MKTLEFSTLLLLLQSVDHSQSEEDQKPNYQKSIEKY